MFLQQCAATSGSDPERPSRDHDARRGPGTDGRDRGGRHESRADDRRHPIEGRAHRRGRRRVHPGRQRGHTAKLRHALCQVHAVPDQKVPHLRTGACRRYNVYINTPYIMILSLV